MKTIRIIGFFLTLITSARAFTAPTSFKEQIQLADAIARIVVVEIAKLEYSGKEEWTFTGLAKCRIVTDYTGSFVRTNFVYIPCNYTFDESPSPLEVAKDYIVSLEVMKHSRIAHPVSHDAAHEVSEGKLVDPESKDSELMVSVEGFEARLRERLKTKAELAGAGQPAATSESKPDGSQNPQLESPASR